MEEIYWTSDLSVGIGLIDTQHKMLIQRLNDLKSAMAKQQGPASVSSTLSFLMDYTDFHFATEEKHMADNDYQDFEAHQKQHAEFKRILSDIEEEFEEEGATQALADSIDSLLVGWLFKHIKSVDVAFGNFLKDNRIALAEKD